MCGARPTLRVLRARATSARATCGRRVNGARCVTFSVIHTYKRDNLGASHHLTQTWKRRWFVLRPAHLAYYKTSAEYQLHRLLELQDVHACTPVVLKRRGNTFGVVTATRTYYLQAESQQDARAWVDAIRGAREAQLATAAAAPGASSSPPIPIPGHSSLAAITPSPPSRMILHAVTSSESEDASPNARMFAAAPSSTAGAVPSSPRIGGPPDTSKVVMTGYITKMGKRRNWRKRWFTLNGEMLMYAGSHMVSRQRRSMWGGALFFFPAC